MIRMLALTVVLTFLMSMNPAFVSYAKEKGASESAMENARAEAIFHRVGDWFATVGKSPEEAQVIMAERKAIRLAEKMERKAQKAKEEARKKAKELKEKLKKKKGY